MSSKKLQNQLFKLDDPEKIIKFAKSFSSKEFLLLINPDLQNEDQYWKLSYLLTGISHQVFHDALNLASKEQLDILKEKCVEESLQQHLTWLTHHVDIQLDKFSVRVEKLEREIIDIDLESLTFPMINTVKNQINLLSLECQKLLNQTDRYLELAWNSNRLDLLEKLNHVKKCIESCLIDMIGAPQTNQTQANGFYKLLSVTLESIYSHPIDKMDPDSLKDSEPAIEGITKLGIVDLNDYYKVGLLKKRPSKTENGFQAVKAVNQSLINAGLKTVKDLKENQIFSFSCLKEFLMCRNKT